MTSRPSPLRRALPLLLIAALVAAIFALSGRREVPGADAPKVWPAWYLDPASPRPPEAPEANVPRTLEDLTEGDGSGTSRCREPYRTDVFLLVGDRLVSRSKVPAFVRQQGSILVDSRRGADLEALPVAVLLEQWPETQVVEIWPCDGEPLRLSAEELQAGPERWLLVATPKGFLKLVDRDLDPDRHVTKNLAAIRLVP